MNMHLKTVDYPKTNPNDEKRWNTNMSKNWQIDEDKFLEDLTDGRRFLILAQALTKKNDREIRCESDSNLRHAKLLNVQKFIQLIEEYGRRNFVNIRSSDIVDGNRKLILALMW